MKTSIIKNRILQFVSVASLFAATSCQKAEEEVLPQQIEEIAIEHSNARSSASTTYTIAPSLNTYTNCGSVVVSSGTCGTYVGGNIRAKVIKSNGSQFVIRIERCNNQQLFGAVGMAYVNATNFCGTQAGKTQIAANHWYSDVTINATFTTGSVDFVPVVILPGQNIRWFGQPIRITAQPIDEPVKIVISNSGSGLPFGTRYGYVNDVEVISNGPNANFVSSQRSSHGIKWQCVEFVRRYYSQVYKKEMGSGANAKDFYGRASTWGMKAYVNGGSVAPKVGDVLCLAENKDNPAGHVAIIIEVTSSDIKVAQQNVGRGTHIRFSISKSGNRISNALGSSVQGWIRL